MCIIHHCIYNQTSFKKTWYVSACLSISSNLQCPSCCFKCYSIHGILDDTSSKIGCYESSQHCSHVLYVCMHSRAHTHILHNCCSCTCTSWAPWCVHHPPLSSAGERAVAAECSFRQSLRQWTQGQLLLGKEKSESVVTSTLISFGQAKYSALINCVYINKLRYQDCQTCPKGKSSWPTRCGVSCTTQQTRNYLLSICSPELCAL